MDFYPPYTVSCPRPAPPPPPPAENGTPFPLLLVLNAGGVSHVGISFFRRVCDDYFRPGCLVPCPTSQGFGETGDGNDDTQGGVAESKGSGVDAPGDAVDSDKESDVLTEAMMRADYVNSLNAFNQLEVREQERLGLGGRGEGGVTLSFDLVLCDAMFRLRLAFRFACCRKYVTVKFGHRKSPRSLSIEERQ